MLRLQIKQGIYTGCKILAAPVVTFLWLAAKSYTTHNGQFVLFEKVKYRFCPLHVIWLGIVFYKSQGVLKQLLELFWKEGERGCALESSRLEDSTDSDFTVIYKEIPGPSNQDSEEEGFWIRELGFPTEVQI